MNLNRETPISMARVEENAHFDPTPFLGLAGTLPDALRLDLETAREVQRDLLPFTEQRWQGLHVLADYRPAHAVGGDLFDVIRSDTGAVTALIGDVSGKGVTAALLMARIGSELSRLAREGLDPGTILHTVDRWMESLRLRDKFVTAACVTFDPRQCVWRSANAGHVAPILWRDDGQIIHFAHRPGPPLGLGSLATSAFDEQSYPARPGDILLLVTDGVVEGLSGLTREPNPAGISPLLEGLPHRLKDVRTAVFDGLESISGFGDDATFLGLHLDDEAFRPIR